MASTTRTATQAAVAVTFEIDASRPSTGEFAARMMQDVSTTILLVDSDELGRTAMSEQLTRNGFLVNQARSAAEARAMMAQIAFDMVLCELDLPDARGIEVVRRWKRESPSRPVLVVCRTRDQEARMAAFDAGADDVMDKGTAMRELILRVEAHDRSVRATYALQQALRQADHLRLYAAEAAALLAHDLNNGLCIAMANADYVASVDAVSADPEVEDAVDTVARTLRRMSILVRNFVDIARSEDGALVPALAKTDVGELLATAAAIHHPRGKQIELVCPPHLEAAVDATLLERVVHNLLINAVRYVDASGRVRLTARREPVAAYAADGWPAGELIITVSNTGPRIPDHLRHGLFEKYVKGSDRKAQTGMGLYFCRIACEAHGGTVTLVNDREFATCFEIRIPIKAR